MTGQTKIRTTKGDIMIALRIIAITLLVFIVFFGWDRSIAQFVLAAMGWSEIALGLRYLGIVVRETPTVYNMTVNNGTGELSA